MPCKELSEREERVRARVCKRVYDFTAAVLPLPSLSTRSLRVFAASVLYCRGEGELIESAAFSIY